MKLYNRRLVCILILLSLCCALFAGCRDESQETDDPTATATGRDRDSDTDSDNAVESAIIENYPTAQGEAEFDLYLDELFAKEVVVDSITLNYFLADPSAFGIEMPDPTYGEVTSFESIERGLEEDRELRDRLSAFQYETLRPDQQLIYDTLVRNLDIFEAMDADDDAYYFLSSIHPTSGIQVQLPVLLAEFNFRRAEDIEIYLQLLGDTQRYFREMIEFERERSRRGFFMSEANTDEVIENCVSYLANREDNLLILVFNDKMDEYEGLAEEQREQYKQRNRELVLNNVLAAYDELLDAMRELRGQGANEEGLASLPGGPEYAGLYLQYTTGSDKTPEQVADLIEEQTNLVLGTIWEILDRDSVLADAYFDSTLGIIPDEEPEFYLRWLEKRSATDFPKIKAVDYVVHVVHESLQEFLSPAFYLVPAVDSFSDNVIYINPASISDNLSLYTTLAHEGYPGHLYQHVYHLQQSPHPLWILLGTTGYTEGWATYVGQWGYYNAGLGEDEATLMQYTYMYNILLLSQTDIGVNALGWGKAGAASYLKGFGITDPAAVDEIYQMVTADPLSYLPYCLGYIEILSLLDEAERSLGEDFELVEFHRFMLDIGPAPFPLIRERMQGWIEEQAASALSPAA